MTTYSEMPTTPQIRGNLSTKYCVKGDQKQKRQIYSELTKNLVSNLQKICNAMNKHFVELGEKLSAKVPIDANHESMYKQFPDN